MEQPFDRIDIASETETYGASLSHPFYRTPRRQLLAELVFERRRSETFIFKGTPFEISFPFYLQAFPDADITRDGETEVSVIRVRQE
ncbi:MAG: hypothetical protein ACREYC_23105, partial [Gammaproteobacteria bacterium]